MAHGNYNCCAICDGKMDYAGLEAETKEEICEECLKNIKELNLRIENIEDLKTFIRETDYKTLKETLIKLNFYFCCYNNELDDFVLMKFKPSFMTLEEYIKRNDKHNYDIIEKENK